MPTLKTIPRAVRLADFAQPLSILGVRGLILFILMVGAAVPFVAEAKPYLAGPINSDFSDEMTKVTLIASSI